MAGREYAGISEELVLAMSAKIFFIDEGFLEPA